jgi:hypothetical protein
MAGFSWESESEKKTILRASKMDAKNKLSDRITLRMRHSLFKYFTDRKWAEAFLNGEVLFRSLSYFRDYEDKNVRGDHKEGVSVFRPGGGLIVTNHTQGRTFTMTDSAFEAIANQEDIFAFCVSRSLTDELCKTFGAVVSVEILKIPILCERIKSALPETATFRAGRVEYYDPNDAPNPRWALPDQIALSKFEGYKWQNEFRFLFSLTNALQFEIGSHRIVMREGAQVPKPDEHHEYLLKTRSLVDICRIHEF